MQPGPFVLVVVTSVAVTTQRAGTQAPTTTLTTTTAPSGPLISTEAAVSSFGKTASSLVAVEQTTFSATTPIVITPTAVQLPVTSVATTLPSQELTPLATSSSIVVFPPSTAVLEPLTSKEELTSTPGSLAPHAATQTSGSIFGWISDILFAFYLYWLL